MISSREKGHRGEREVAAILRRFGIEARRGDQNRGGEEQPDIVHTIMGIHLEVKRRETINIWAALKQSETESTMLEVPVVAFRRNRSRWYVALPLEDWLRQLGYREVK